MTLCGTIEFLTVVNKEGSTYHLKFEEEKNVNIRMNASVTNQDYEIGDEISCFVYPNRSGELFASPHLPSVTKDKFGYATVVDVNREGAYVNINAPRDILIPWNDLPKVKRVWPKPGDELFITLRVERDQQLYGKLITEEQIAHRYTPLKESDFESIKNKWFNGRPYRLLKVGTFILTEEGYKAFVHESERKDEPRLGELVQFRAIGINDKGEINGSFHQQAYKKMNTDSEIIYDYIVNNGGRMPLNDKSSPEDIKEAFNMSKASFKRALGKLMKEDKIVQTKIETQLKQ